MAFDNDEQQSEYFKNFYNLHKVKIFSAIAVFLVAFFAYQYLESVNQSKMKRHLNFSKMFLYPKLAILMK